MLHLVGCKPLIGGHAIKKCIKNIFHVLCETRSTFRLLTSSGDDIF